MVWFAYAMAWLSTALACIAGIHFTHSPWCLWVFLIPGCIKLTSGKESEEKIE